VRAGAVMHCARLSADAVLPILLAMAERRREPSAAPARHGAALVRMLLGRECRRQVAEDARP
jgi:hypothetical protein